MPERRSQNLLDSARRILTEQMTRESVRNEKADQLRIAREAQRRGFDPSQLSTREIQQRVPDKVVEVAQRAIRRDVGEGVKFGTKLVADVKKELDRVQRARTPGGVNLAAPRIGGSSFKGNPTRRIGPGAGGGNPFRLFNRIR